MKARQMLEGAFLFASDVAAAFLGSELAEDKKGREGVGRELRKALMPDREDVLKELERLGPDGEAILSLLEDANTLHGGVITVRTKGGGTKRYTENWVINRLLAIEPKDRGWVFVRFNQLCRDDPAAFLARLEILNNDWYTQYLRLIAANAGEGLRRIDEDVFGPLAEWLGTMPGGEEE